LNEISEFRLGKLGLHAQAIDVLADDLASFHAFSWP